MGVAFLVLQVPCVIKISSVCARLRLKTAKVTDQRLTVLNEMVTGIRALKTHAWETNYKKNIQELRGYVGIASFAFKKADTLENREGVVDHKAIYVNLGLNNIGAVNFAETPYP